MVLGVAEGKAMKTRGIPVIMYHSVGPLKPGWDWNTLVMPMEVFEGQMRMLKQHGWTTISLGALHDHIANGAPLPENPVVLTFDDGYLDNWVFAYPILKKYGHHAVIWSSTDFVDRGSTVRPTLEDVWEGKVPETDLPTTGFLSWDEMRIMIEGGTVEIQSHAKTHTWYFSGSTIVDFHRPRGADGYIPYQWLSWNRNPERKHEFMTVGLEALVPYGTPVYEYGEALAVRRYYEDESLTARLVQHVSDNGRARFFSKKGWRRELMDIVKTHPPQNDRFETEEEYEARVRSELTESRRDIEKELGTKVDFLCWPGGGRNPKNLHIAEEVGYLATTTHYRDKDRKNIHGQNPREINREGCGSPWIWHGAVIRRTDPRYFRAILENFNGSKSAIWLMRLYKLKYILRHYLLGID